MDTTQPFTFQCLVDRLYGDYLLHKSLFIAFDFDNTIFDYHNAGRDFHHIIDVLKKCSDHGHKLILFAERDSSYPFLIAEEKRLSLRHI